MKARHTPVLMVAIALVAAPGAGAHMLWTEHSMPTRAAASTTSSAVALRSAAIGFQVRKNVREERLLGSSS